MLHYSLLQVVVDVRPSIDDLIIALLIGDKTHIEVGLDLIDLVLATLHDLCLFLWHDDVIEVEGKTGKVRHAVTKVLHTVKERAGTVHTHMLDHVGDELTQSFLRDDTVEEAYLLRDDLVDDDTSHGSLYDMTDRITLLVNVVDEALHLSVLVNSFLIESDDSLFRAVEGLTLTLGTRTDLGDIVKAEHHILRRHGDRSTIGRVEDVVALKHQNLRFQHGLVAQRQVNSHLVTIEVSVERRTSQWVELDSLTLDHLWLESHHRQTVKRRSTVQEHRVTLHHVLKNIPDHRLTAVHNLLSALDRLHDAALNELADDERLVEFGSHQLRQATLTHLQLRTDDDHRTGRVVDTLTEQVLTEAALLTFQRVREGLQRTVALALHGAGLAAVVEERVNSLLEHTFLVTENHLWSLDLDESFQTVVTDDDTTIEVVEVGSGETATVQRNQRTQLWRNDRNDLHDHPLRLVHILGATESLHDLQTLQGLGLAHLAGVAVGTVTQLIAELVEVDLLEQVKDSLGTHLGDELRRISIVEHIVVLRNLVVDDVEILFL